jgi:hypothetical protein
MIPIEHIHSCKMKTLTPLTYFEYRNQNKKSILICGSSDDPQALLLDEDDRRFTAFSLKGNTNDIEGVYINNIEIELDLSSMISDKYANAPYGSLIISPSGAEIVAKTYSHFNSLERTNIIIHGEHASPYSEEKSYFTSWRILSRNEFRDKIWSLDINVT